MKDIKEFKKKDAAMLRKYCIDTIEDPNELTKNKNDAAKILARMQHLVQPERITQKVMSKEDKIKERELTTDEEKLLEQLRIKGE